MRGIIMCIHFTFGTGSLISKEVQNQIIVAFCGFSIYNQDMAATNDFVSEYKTVGDPGKQEKARNWDIAIGLQIF